MTHSREQFLDRRKREQFHKLAKGENIRARSYFKLEQLDKKFNLINDNMNIIDLGAAPGGWLQYIDSKVNTGKIVAIDLLEIKRQSDFSENVEIIEDDFNNIEEYVKDKFDLVLSDMAPEFGGNSQVDRGKTHKLNLLVLEFCKDHLRVGGNCAFKTFEGEDLEIVRKEASKIFENIKEFKPRSSQKRSAETFLACFSKRNK